MSHLISLFTNLQGTRKRCARPCVFDPLQLYFPIYLPYSFILLGLGIAYTENVLYVSFVALKEFTICSVICTLHQNDYW